MPLPHQIEEREERQESRDFWNEKLSTYMERYLEAFQLCIDHVNARSSALTKTHAKQQQPQWLRELASLITAWKVHENMVVMILIMIDQYEEEEEEEVAGCKDDENGDDSGSEPPNQAFQWDWNSTDEENCSRFQGNPPTHKVVVGNSLRHELEAITIRHQELTATLDTLVKSFSEYGDNLAEVKRIMSPPRDNFSQIHEMIACT
ncbi:hypothetical protein BLS_001857 [Venturia inaequalis]|uniref:Uncharacterized protein n=1 Tax=Venturia inaequalis TaxID=5025 RepID=A0A8H3UJN8_VENIN|nr:hypothetical protein EG328_006294 [Venturia inaequalis]KAE9976789.1 hypothetical protein BLS_001857 [Venturia inaequalis]KAE9991880.1 hypothetical protein EG327_010667 [Venturia inaequalis]